MKTTNEIIDELRNRSSLSTEGDEHYTNENLLVKLNSTLLSIIYPLILQINRSSWLTSEDKVVKQRTIPIPHEAYALGLYEVALINDNYETNLKRHEFINRGEDGFAIIGNDLVFSKNYDGRRIRLYYNRKINKLILNNAAFIPTMHEAINDQTYQIVDNLEATIEQGQEVVFQSANDPFKVQKSKVEDIISDSEGNDFIRTKIRFADELNEGSVVTPKDTVLYPELIDPGVNLLILKTALTLNLTDTTKESLKAETFEAEESLKTFLIERVKLESTSWMLPNPAFDEMRYYY